MTTTNYKKVMAEAAADWWVNRLDPVHGWILQGNLTREFQDNEIARFREALVSEIHRALERYSEPVFRLKLESLNVGGMVHTGLLADVAEQADLTGIIFHLPRARMALCPHAGFVAVENVVIWDRRQIEPNHVYGPETTRGNAMSDREFSMFKAGARDLLKRRIVDEPGDDSGQT